MHTVDDVPELAVHDHREAWTEDLGGVHGWLCNLDEQESGPVALSLLSSVERTRAARLRRDLDRRRFVARCAFVRRVLGGLVRRPAESLVFRNGGCGKPYLSDGIGRNRDGARTLHFSLSHSEDVLGLAVASNGEVGIDLEVVRPIPDPLAIAAQFDPECLDLLRSRPAPEREFLFYRAWTRREAFAKMQGRGIACRHVHEPPPVTRWTLRAFTFRQDGRRIVGACALESPRPA